MPRPLPVLFIVQHLDHGGTEFHFQDLVTRLDRSRIAPHVIYSTPGAVSRKLEAAGDIPILRIPIQRAYDASGMRAIWQVRRYLKEHCIEGIVSFHFVADFVATLATFGKRSIPVISSRRDMGFTRTWRQIRIGRWLGPSVARYIAVSDAVRKAVAADERVPASKIEVIYNGLELARLDAQSWDLIAERKRHDLAPDDLVIGCVANFNPVKQHLTLLEAFARLRQAHPDRKLRLLLTGDGPMRGAIKERIQALELSDAVRLPGQSPQITPDYPLADIFVLPSETEGFSNAIVQAMLQRRPVVACRVGGNPEAVIEGKTGLLVDPCDARQLTNALGLLVEDAELRRRMGTFGRERAEKLFTLESMMEQTQHLIEAVIAEEQAGKRRG